MTQRIGPDVSFCPVQIAMGMTVLPQESFAYKYGFMFLWDTGMKTTVELPDDLYRQAKAEAALRGRKLKDLVEEGLRLVLHAPREAPERPSLAGLMESARGIFDSGVSDLGSNPKHLEGLGRDKRRNR